MLLAVRGKPSASEGDDVILAVISTVIRAALHKLVVAIITRAACADV